MLTRDVLAELRCPYCAGPLALGREVCAAGRAISDAIVHCPCGEFPVVAGVLWLSKRRAALAPGDPPAMAAALDRLREGDAPGALVEALLESARHRTRRLATGLSRLEIRPPRFLVEPVRRFLRRQVIDDDRLTFARAVYLLRDKPYADYLFHRFANPSLLAAIPVILLLQQIAGEQRGRPARVIDIGGGSGHATFLMARFFPGLDTVLTDGDFTNLYLAGRFLAPAATRICLDAEASLPFADASAEAVFSMDAFHYMRAKAGLVRELRRIARPGALWLFPHLHNALAHNPAAGYPLPPSEYRRLFESLPGRLFAEPAILERFHREQVIDLSVDPAEAGLEKAPALVLLAGPPALWRRHDLAGLFLRAGPDLAVNRVYRPGAHGELRMQWPSAQLEAECAACKGFLEATPSIDRALLSRVSAGELDPEDAPAVQTLIRDFALVPLPARYGQRE